MRPQGGIVRAVIALGVLGLSLAGGGGDSAAPVRHVGPTPQSENVFDLLSSVGDCQGGTSPYVPLISVKAGDYLEADTRYHEYDTVLEDADIALESDATGFTIWNPTEAANRTLPQPLPYMPYQGRVHTFLVTADSTFKACAGSPGYPPVWLTFTLRINYPPKPDYSTDLARNAAFQYGEALHAMAAWAAAAANSAYLAGRPDLGGFMSAYAAWLADTGDEFTEFARDPPDTNYTVIAPPVVRALRQQPYTTAHGLTQLEVNALNALATNMDQSLALSGAMLTAQERAWGAHDAHDAVWEGRQRAARASYMAQLSPPIAAMPGLLANLQAALQADGVAGTVTQANIANFQSSVAANGLPSAITDALTDLGADAATQQRMRSYLQTERPALAAALGGGTFPQGLTDPTVTGAMVTVAQTLAPTAPLPPPQPTVPVQNGPRPLPTARPTVPVVIGPNPVPPPRP